MNQEQVRELFDLHGAVLVWRVSRGRSKAGTPAGCNKRGIRVIKIDGKQYKISDLVWMHKYGTFPPGDPKGIWVNIRDRVWERIIEREGPEALLSQE